MSKPDGSTFKQNTDLTAVAFRLINYDLPSGIGGFSVGSFGHLREQAGDYFLDLLEVGFDLFKRP